MLQENRAAISNPSAEVNGGTIEVMSDKLGKVVVVNVAPRELVVDATITLSASIAETTLVAAGAAGVFHHLTNVVVANTSVATATRVDFRSATGGAVRFSVNIPGNSTVVVPTIVPIAQAAAANNWTAQCSVSTIDVRIYAQAAKNL